MTKKSYKVNALRNGTVIDHLRPWTALKVMRALGIDAPSVVTIGINLESKKNAAKDIVKIENKELTHTEIDKIVLIDPEATINIIRDYQVVRKFKVKVPERLEGIARCSNPSCITNHEQVATRFEPVAGKSSRMRCYYCERIFLTSEMELL